MEEYKRRYLQNFLLRTEVCLEDFIKVIKEKEEMVRMCYAETMELNSDDFVKMILMDAAFIFEVLLMFLSVEDPPYDRVFGSPRKKYGIFIDLYMLENQLPFFILEDLFTVASINIPSNENEELSMLKLTHKLTKVLWPYLGVEKSFDENNFSGVKHLVDFLRICIVPSETLQQKERPAILTTPSVTELHQAGVKFKLRSSKNLFDIRFKNGILEIPRITIRSPLEYMMKNLLAFDQSQCKDPILNDYVIFINYLVNTPKDVELLVQHRIIHNPVGDSELVSTLFHRLVERPTINENFYFSHLIEDLNVYCRRPWHKWKATLKQDYFKTPWTTVSVIAAIILLILTLTQAICSIPQVI